MIKITGSDTFSCTNLHRETNYNYVSGMVQGVIERLQYKLFGIILEEA